MIRTLRAAGVRPAALTTLPAAALLFAALTALPASAQSGRVLDALTLHSDILGKDMRYAVYLPPDYDASQRRYPVLYLLHGMGDDQSGWIQFGEVLHIADESVRDGSATPMVIVMPDGSGPPPGYVNTIDGKWRFEDFFFDELMPTVEKTYRIQAQKRFRAVAGLSMGGNGTFLYALHRPDLFSSAAPLSAWVGYMSLDELRGRAGASIEGLPDAQVAAWFARHDVLGTIRAMTDETKRAVRWYIDCGDDDFLFEGNALVHIEMHRAGVTHEYRVREGGHTWTYWREALPTVLEFVSAGFHQY